MTLVKWKSNRSMLNIFDDVERMVNQAFGGKPMNFEDSFTTTPPMNISESDSAYEVEIELPGVDKKEVTVNVVDGVLTVSGARKTHRNSEDENLIWNEISYGSFKRSFQLAGEIQEEKIKATFQNGMLSLDIPKAEEVKPKAKKITIS
ncbi:MAG: Hsp20/alpha crystallin family protein [Candidatus Marinimicrobia bacterium]|nr:Hsp20/alpha crystallin family protein [Candidatus Neomarinimicrobiota bacterium]